MLSAPSLDAALGHSSSPRLAAVTAERGPPNVGVTPSVAAPARVCRLVGGSRPLVADRQRLARRGRTAGRPRAPVGAARSSDLLEVVADRVVGLLAQPHQPRSPALSRSSTAPATPQCETPPLDDRIEHLVFAVSEAVTNALTHGRPPVRFRLWTAPDRIVATVTDRGDGPADPFAGLLPVTDTCSAGLGLWLTHQLCSHVTLDTTDDGFTIRLVVGTPQPGRSGHAPDTA